MNITMIIVFIRDSIPNHSPIGRGHDPELRHCLPRLQHEEPG
jgi:hypothetical protein